MQDYSGTLSRKLVTFIHSDPRRSTGASTAEPPVQGGSASDKDSPVTIYVDHFNSASRPNSLRGAKFAALHEALLTLCTFPPGHDYYLAPEAATRASDYLGVISKNLEIDPPRFFPQDGEAAVFTWDLGVIKRLFTVDAEEEDLMDVNRKSMVRCDHHLPDNEAERLAAILKELGGQHFISSGSSLDSDV